MAVRPAKAKTYEGVQGLLGTGRNGGIRGGLELGLLLGSHSLVRAGEGCNLGSKSCRKKALSWFLVWVGAGERHLEKGAV